MRSDNTALLEKGAFTYEGKESSFITEVSYIPPYTQNWEGTHSKARDHVVKITMRNQHDVDRPLKALGRKIIENKTKAFIDHADGHTTYTLSFMPRDRAVAENWMILLMDFIQHSSERKEYLAFLEETGIAQERLPAVQKSINYDI